MATRRILIDGLRFPESPRWHNDQVWVADWGVPEIVATTAAGEQKTALRVPSSPCSFDWTPDGHLLVVSGGNRQLLKLGQGGHFVPHADLSTIADESWNEIAVGGGVGLYVNSIGFAFAGDVPPSGRNASGVIALVTTEGGLRRVADGLSFPNGMVVTPDGATLIVAESWANRLTAFDIGPDGDLSSRRVWAMLDGYPDGICLDADGAVWYADVPNKRCVRVREGGKVLAVEEFDRGCFACALGGPTGHTLFAAINEWSGPSSIGGDAIRGQVVALEAPAPGAKWPSI